MREPAASASFSRGSPHCAAPLLPVFLYLLFVWLHVPLFAFLLAAFLLDAGLESACDRHNLVCTEHIGRVI